MITVGGALPPLCLSWPLRLHGAFSRVLINSLAVPSVRVHKSSMERSNADGPVLMTARAWDPLLFSARPLASAASCQCVCDAFCSLALPLLQFHWCFQGGTHFTFG